MTPVIKVAQLTRTYRKQKALDDVAFAVQTNTITGLLGRNGAGKSTLMRIITAQEFASSGTVQVFGESPVENDAVLRRMVFVREDQVFPDFKVKHVIKAASWFYPNWDAELAETLLTDFDLPPNRQIKKLSRGMRSAVGIVIGLAARADLTLLDEPYAGLDAVARGIFYDRLLADYSEHPRTILLSTHLIDEVADLLEHVLVIDRGRITMDAAADDVRDRAVTVSGTRGAVDDFVTGHIVWHRQTLGARGTAVMAGPLTDLDRARAGAVGLELRPVSLQQLVVYTAGTTPERASA